MASSLALVALCAAALVGCSVSSAPPPGQGSAAVTARGSSAAVGPTPLDVPVERLDIGALPFSGGAIQVAAKSCSTTGNCVAGGGYSPVNHSYTASWLAVETAGKWGSAFNVPGLVTMDVGGDDGVSWVDCPAGGNCVAGGFYDDDPNAILVSFHLNAWVADETDGHWGRAIAVPGLAALNVGDDASLDVGACPAVGFCQIAGEYMDGSDTYQRYTDTQVRGVWQRAHELGARASFAPQGDPTFTALTCASATSCVASGSYANGGSFHAAYRAGVWKMTETEPTGSPARPPTTPNHGPQIAALTATDTVYDEPAAGTGMLLAAIDRARRSVTLTMYELRDPGIIDALAAAHRRGVTVRVILDRAYHGGAVNKDAYQALTAAGAAVRWGPAQVIVHQKTLVTDRTAWIGTGNLDDNDYATSWDAWVRDTDADQVAAIAATFAADWAAAPDGRLGTATSAAGLVWSPGAGPAMLDAIDSARRSVDFTSEELSDAAIAQALADDARRGATCRIVMTADPDWTSNLDEDIAAGCHVHLVPDTETAPYVHIKQIITDDNSALIGSTNASISSIDYNRELSIQLRTPAEARAIANLKAAFDNHYQQSQPIP